MAAKPRSKRSREAVAAERTVKTARQLWLRFEELSDEGKTAVLAHPGGKRALDRLVETIAEVTG